MIHREDAEQRALIKWADIVPMPAGMALYTGAKIGDYLFAIPNGGARGRIEAARLIGLGVRAGVSDLLFSFPSYDVPPMHGLYIEMKAPKPYGKRETDKQRIFLSRMNEAGYETTVCYGWDEARAAIAKYLGCDL
ncbi:MAG: VRR-NUC domain-containing protein [Acidiferrobacterales bacterium]